MTTVIDVHGPTFGGEATGRASAPELAWRLPSAACSSNRRGYLAPFTDDAVWDFPVAPHEPRTLVGKEAIERVMGPRWDVPGIDVRLVESTVSALAVPALALSQFALEISVGGAGSRIRRFAHILRARDGLIVSLTH